MFLLLTITLSFSFEITSLAPVFLTDGQHTEPTLNRQVVAHCKLWQKPQLKWIFRMCCIHDQRMILRPEWYNFYPTCIWKMLHFGMRLWQRLFKQLLVESTQLSEDILQTEGEASRWEIIGSVSRSQLQGEAELCKVCKEGCRYSQWFSFITSACSCKKYIICTGHLFQLSTWLEMTPQHN